VKTIATWVPCSIQALDDLEMLQRFIDSKLVYGLKLKEETELLTGDGLGDHINGLTSEATGFLGSYNDAADTRLDRLRNALHEMADNEEDCDFFCIHPDDYYAILGLKDAAATTGKYLIGSPLEGFEAATIWGKTTIVSNSMSTGFFLAGNTTACMIHDRKQAAVRISTEHSDYWTSNLCVVLAEERVALTVHRATAFVIGSFLEVL
jgi:HK97 family phage major capsid protein